MRARWRPGAVEASICFIESRRRPRLHRWLPGQNVRGEPPLPRQFDTLPSSLFPGWSMRSPTNGDMPSGRRPVRGRSRFTAPAVGETRGVAFACTGDRPAEHWVSPSREVDFFDARSRELGARAGRDVRLAPQHLVIRPRQRSVPAVSDVGVVGQSGLRLSTIAGRPPVPDRRGLARSRAAVCGADRPHRIGPAAATPSVRRP